MLDVQLAILTRRKTPMGRIMDRLQVNFRLTTELMEALDKRRVDLLHTEGRIPTRSEVIRNILEADLLRKAATDKAGKSRSKKA